MIARTALVALLLAIAIGSLASRAEAASAAEDPPKERPACRVVKVVYAGHGEAERAPCRHAS